MKIVLDTNVLVSGLIKPHSNPAKIVNLVTRREVNIFFDSRIFSEYENVLLREQFKFDPEKIAIFLDYLKRIGQFISPKPLSIKMIDPYDLPFYEVALSSNSLLITENIKHFPNNKQIIFTPKDFLEFYNLER